MKVRFDDKGLVACVVQDAVSGQVLMVGWMNDEALRKTAEEKRLWLWSRSRGRLWMKGEESGNTMGVLSVTADCDGDSVLAKVVPSGPACHTGSFSCFGRLGAEGMLGELERICRARQEGAPEGSYTARLLSNRLLLCEKLIEETGELLEAEEEEEVVWEAADLFYHLIVLLASENVAVADVLGELARRAKYKYAKMAGRRDRK